MMCSERAPSFVKSVSSVSVRTNQHCNLSCTVRHFGGYISLLYPNSLRKYDYSPAMNVFESKKNKNKNKKRKKNTKGKKKEALFESD